MEINYWGVLVCGIVSMIIGSVWYGSLFGKIFMEASGMNLWSKEKQEAEKKKMPWLYFGQLVASLVMFFVLDWYIVTSMHSGVYGGMVNAFGLWLGFVVPVSFGSALWGGSFKMFWLTSGNMFVTLLAAGAILGGWR